MRWFIITDGKVTNARELMPGNGYFADCVCVTWAVGVNMVFQLLLLLERDFRATGNIYSQQKLTEVETEKVELDISWCAVCVW